MKYFVVFFLFFLLISEKILQGEELKILAYNVFLRPGLVGKDDYKSERFAELREAVRPYDVIGLSEVFDDGLREQWKNHLYNTHPYAIDPPESSNIFFQDGGITFFSRYPVIFHKKMIYKASSGWDACSEKGAIFARLQLPSNKKIEVVLSHTQADEKNFDVRKKQFDELRKFFQQYQTSVPLFIIGDLNVIGDKDQQYPDMLARLLNPIDGYRLLHTDPGYTYYLDNPFCGSGSKERLDYILMQNGHNSMWKNVLVSKFPMAHPVGKAKYMSDHYAVEATMDFYPESKRDSAFIGGNLSVTLKLPVSLSREVQGSLSIKDAQGNRQTQKFVFQMGAAIKQLFFSRLAQGRAIMLLESENRNISQILEIQENNDILVSLPFGTASFQYLCPSEWENITLRMNGPMSFSQNIQAGQKILLSDMPYGRYHIQIQMGEQIWNKEMIFSPYQRNDLSETFIHENRATLYGTFSARDLWETQEILLVPQKSESGMRIAKASIHKQGFILAGILPGQYSLMLRQYKGNLYRMVILPVVLSTGEQRLDIQSALSDASRNHFFLPSLPSSLVFITKDKDDHPLQLDRTTLSQSPHFSWIPLSEGETCLSCYPDGDYSFHLYQKQNEIWHYQSTVFIKAKAATYTIEWH